jgi:hypothetical protein
MATNRAGTVRRTSLLASRVAAAMWLLVGVVYAACDGQFEAPCEPGFMSCGEGETDGGSFSASGGCETDIMSDPSNCGGCTIQCMDATCLSGVCVPLAVECIPPCEDGESCVAGTCFASKACEPPLTNCGGDCVDVEANDKSNCGGCGIPCGGDCVDGQCEEGFDSGLPDAEPPPDDGGGFDTGVDGGGAADTGVPFDCVTPCEGLAQCDTSNPSLYAECYEFCTGPTLENCFAQADEEMSEVGEAGYCNLLALCVWQGYFSSECEGMVPTWGGGDSCSSALSCQYQCTSDSCICNCVDEASSSYAFALLDVDVCSEASCSSSCPPDVSSSSACAECQEQTCDVEVEMCIGAEPGG